MASLREQNAYKVLKKGSVGILNCSRVENQVGDGMSDFVVQNESGVEIWLEVKALDVLPRRDSTLWLKGEFRPGQLPFLRERISWGGHGFALLRVDRVWLLLDPTNGPELLSRENQDCVIVHGNLPFIIEYLEGLEIEDCPYAAPNYRPGTLCRKEKFRLSDGARNGQDLDNAG